MTKQLRLPHSETDEDKRYSMPDPDALRAYYDSAYRATFALFDGDIRPLTREEQCALLALAGGYLTLTTYPLGQESTVGKLRDIWRARRATPEAAET